MYCKRLCFVAAAAVAFAVVQAAPVLAAGNVTVVFDENLKRIEIEGDQDDNEIAVYSDDSATVWVEGREETTINDETERVGFPAVGVRIEMRAGDDAVDVRLAPPVGDFILRFFGGRGDDELVVKGGEFRYIGVWTDSESWWIPGGDDVNIQDVMVTKGVDVCTYEGDDQVKIENLIATEWDAYLSVDTGKGKDDVVLRDIRPDFVGPRGEIRVYLGAGHDHIVADTIVTDVFDLWAHPGDDVVELRGNSEMTNAIIDLGDGNDVLDAENGASVVGAFFWLNGGYGRDTLINPAYFQSYVPPAIDGFEVIED